MIGIKIYIDTTDGILIDTMADWCHNNIGMNFKGWSWGSTAINNRFVFVFSVSEDATLFKLRFKL